MIKKAIIFLLLTSICYSCTTPEKRHEKIISEKLSFQHILYDGFKTEQNNIVILFDENNRQVISFSCKHGKSNGFQLKTGSKYEYGIDENNEFMWFISNEKSYVITFSKYIPSMDIKLNVDNKIMRHGNAFRVPQDDDMVEYKIESGSMTAKLLYGITNFMKKNNIANSDVVLWVKQFTDKDDPLNSGYGSNYKSIIFVKTSTWEKKLYQYHVHSDGAVKLSDNCTDVAKTLDGNGVIYVTYQNGTEYLIR